MVSFQWSLAHMPVYECLESATFIKSSLRLFENRGCPAKVPAAFPEACLSDLTGIALHTHSWSPEAPEWDIVVQSWPHGLQHARLPCPSLSPAVGLNSCPLSWQCHPTISSSVAHLSCLQSFPASGSFPVSHLFTSDSQSIGASASAQVLPMKSELISFRSDWFDLLGSRGLSRVFCSTSLKASVLQSSACFMVQLSHLWMTVGETIALTMWTFAGGVMSLLFKKLSKFVVVFLPRSKSLLIPWLQSPPTVILECKKIKSANASIFPHLPWSDGTGYHDLSFLNVEF